MDTGLYVGKRVLWRFRPRGGYGFVLRVPVVIRALTPTGATVEIERGGKQVRVLRSSLASPPTMIGVRPEVEP